jgi:hypothetical protein
MRLSAFRTAQIRFRRDRALVPRLGRLDVQVLLSASAHQAAVAGTARAAHVSLSPASRQAITSGALIAPGAHGYDPTNPVDPSAPPLPSQLLTTQHDQ